MTDSTDPNLRTMNAYNRALRRRAERAEAVLREHADCVPRSQSCPHVEQGELMALEHEREARRAAEAALDREEAERERWQEWSSEAEERANRAEAALREHANCVPREAHKKAHAMAHEATRLAHERANNERDAREAAESALREARDVLRDVLGEAEVVGGDAGCVDVEITVTREEWDRARAAAGFGDGT